MCNGVFYNGFRNKTPKISVQLFLYDEFFLPLLSRGAPAMLRDQIYFKLSIIQISNLLSAGDTSNAHNFSMARPFAVSFHLLMYDQRVKENQQPFVTFCSSSPLALHNNEWIAVNHQSWQPGCWCFITHSLQNRVLKSKSRESRSRPAWCCFRL